MTGRKPGALPVSFGAHRMVVVVVAMVFLVSLAYVLATEGVALWDRMLVITQGISDTWYEWNWSLF